MLLLLRSPLPNSGLLVCLFFSRCTSWSNAAVVVDARLLCPVPVLDPHPIDATICFSSFWLITSLTRTTLPPLLLLRACVMACIAAVAVLGFLRFEHLESVRRSFLMVIELSIWVCDLRDLCGQSSWLI